MKTQTLVVGGAGLIGVFILYRLIQSKSKTVVYGDEFGGAPPIDQSYYFPRLGENEPLPYFPQSVGIPYSPVGNIDAPKYEVPADYDVLPPQDLTPQPESNIETGCTKLCDDCGQQQTGGPFQGGAFSNPIKRLRQWNPGNIITAYGKQA